MIFVRMFLHVVFSVINPFRKLGWKVHHLLRLRSCESNRKKLRCFDLPVITWMQTSYPTTYKKVCTIWSYASEQRVSLFRGCYLNLGGGCRKARVNVQFFVKQLYHFLVDSTDTAYQFLLNSLYFFCSKVALKKTTI